MSSLQVWQCECGAQALHGERLEHAAGCARPQARPLSYVSEDEACQLLGCLEEMLSLSTEGYRRTDKVSRARSTVREWRDHHPLSR